MNKSELGLYLRPEGEARKILVKQIVKQLNEYLKANYTDSKFHPDTQLYHGVGLVINKNTGMPLHFHMMGNQTNVIFEQEELLREDKELAWVFMEIDTKGKIFKVEPAKIRPPEPYPLVNLIEAIRVYNEQFEKK